jgi:DNA repair protein RecN (Recombination protein N)
MLVHVSVRDIALIDSVELSLEPGLTVLTGETGAGKSILVEALLLLLGARASADVVRAGAPEGSVQAQFQIAGPSVKEVNAVLEDNGLPKLDDDGALVLRRVISREGRHKQFVNGALATVAQLKAVAEPLVDFTGQHAHQALLRPGAQTQILDAFGGHDELLDKMASAFGRAKAVAQELASLRDKNAEKERRLDVIRFYLDEIDELDPQPGEDEKLAAEQKRLKNAEGLRLSLAEAQECLTDGSTHAPDALTLLQRGLSALQRAARDDDNLAPLARTLEEAVALVDDVGRGLSRAGDVEADPERLREIDDRLDALKRLMKKHGGDLASVLKAREDLAVEKDTLTGAAERIEHLESDLVSAVRAATEIADQLSARRKAAARKLASAVEAELKPLGMASAKLEVKVEPLAAAADAVVARSDKGGLSARGSDRVEMSFSANAGEPMAPLSKVASGGELSRVLLAVKRALLLNDPVPVSIFDEVDAGVGGAVGEAIGEKLQAIAHGRQVLCISHLAQIAAKADHHLVVMKGIEAGRTVSRVRALTRAERIDEVARMLGGREITATTRRHAEEMLSLASGGRATVESQEQKGDRRRKPPKTGKTA